MQPSVLDTKDRRGSEAVRGNVDEAAVGMHEEIIRRQLLERRAQLEAVMTEVERVEPLRALLGEVDAALARVDAGSYGLCEVCQGPIEADRLRADPLLRYCVEDLTPQERRALQRDLDLARRIQTELLPVTPLVHAGWEAHHHYEPVGPVGGDCCDLAVQGDDLYFLLGDVAGKGVAVSMLMAHLQAMFRSLVALRPPAVELLGRINRLFCESTGTSRYATLVCGRARPVGDVELANAGHCPVLFIRGDEVTALPADGPPVGLFGGAPYAVRTLHLASGQTLVLYTDGASEARGPGGAEYGVERLRQVALASGGRGGAELLRSCLEDLRAHQSAAPRQDDLTMLVLRRTA
jgi:sigma-B regulation protein RsbU (phosphoserine phosphatase)